MVRYFPDGDIGELTEGTDAEVYGFHDCKNKYESNATLQFSTEHKTNEGESCQSFVFSVFRLLPFLGKEAVFAIPRLQNK